jgi:GntR family transcriptional regulator
VEFALDPDTRGALHERIAATVRRAVAEGALRAGARLPTARELAEHLGVNVNTVLRAYRQLSEEHLVELRRGRGVTVIGLADRAALVRMADELLAEAARLGISRGELLALLADRW